MSPPTVRKFTFSATILSDFPDALPESYAGEYFSLAETLLDQSERTAMELDMLISVATVAVTEFTVRPPIFWSMRACDIPVLFTSKNKSEVAEGGDWRSSLPSGSAYQQESFTL